jgi:predicted metal-dependent HD superfamily phosphohydrolase
MPMIKNIFLGEIARLSADQSFPEKFWAEIEIAYSKPSRHYHNLLHLDNLVNELLPIKDKISDWQTLIMSVAYHDIVYNTLSQDNEEKSAAIARDRLSRMNVSEWQKDKCYRQIMATKKHPPSNDTDTDYFTDADLAVLGAHEAAYETYSKQIRKEYIFYPDLLYKPGRKKVLSHFLACRAIYKTSWFHHKYEEQARINLANELEKLS